MPKLQSGDLPEALLDRLTLDALPDGIEIETGDIHVVYDVAQFLGSEQVGTFSLDSIDTTLVQVLDHEADDELPGCRFGLDRQRFYQSVVVQMDGVSVSPITTKLFVRRAGTANGVMVGQADIVNPGRKVWGPVYVAPRNELVVRTYTNGGIGDTCEVWLQGFSAPAGAPLPILPGMLV